MKRNNINSRRRFIKTNLLGFFTLPLLPFFSFKEDLTTTQEPTISSLKDLKNQYYIQVAVTHLNTASIGLSPKVVVESIYAALKDFETRGRNGDWLVEAARETVSNYIGSTPNNLAFTRNATEGINIAANTISMEKGDEILLTHHEHIGGSLPWIKKAKEVGAKIKFVDLNLDGKGNLDLVSKSITSKTKVFSFSHVLCTTGMVLPVKEIVKICRDNKIISCIDGAQSIGMLKLNLQDIDPDFYIGSGYKWLGGPKGTGLIHIRQNILDSTSPAFVGANSDQKFELMSGTITYKNQAKREEYGNRNIPLIIGIKTAVEFLDGLGMDKVEHRNSKLAYTFMKKLKEIKGVEVLTPNEKSLYSSIVTFRVKSIDYMDLFERLRVEKHIRVRKVYENNLNAIRVSFSIVNTEEDLNYLIKSLKDIVG